MLEAYRQHVSERAAHNGHSPNTLVTGAGGGTAWSF